MKKSIERRVKSPTLRIIEDLAEALEIRVGAQLLSEFTCFADRLIDGGFVVVVEG